MNYIEQIDKYIQLVTADSNTINEICAKYAMLADAYAGSAGTQIITSNRDTYQVLLSTPVRTYMKYQFATGRLNKVSEGNPNFDKLFNKDSAAYIDKIATNLKSEGWVYPKDISIDGIKQALVTFGLPEVSTSNDIKDADVIAPDTEISKEEADVLKKITFDDDIDFDEVLGSEQQSAPGTIDDDLDLELEKYADEGEPEVYEDESSEEADLMHKLASEYGAAEIEPDKDDTVDDDAEIARKIQEQDEIIRSKVEEQKEIKKEQEIDKEIKKIEAENPEIDPMIVNSTVKSIMNIYDVIYPSLFQSTPAGIMTSSGIITVKSDNSLMEQASGKLYASRVFQAFIEKTGNAIRQYDYHNDISIECINPDGTLKYNYVPYYHVHNIYGIYRGQDGTLKREKNWSKFRSKLAASVTSAVTKLLQAFKGDPLVLSANLVELFTTVFVADEFDIQKSVQLKAKSISLSNTYGDCSVLGNLIMSGTAFDIDKSAVECIDNSSGELGVQSILIVFDKRRYQREILFAYKPLEKIIESGGRVGCANTLLGRDLQGKNVTFNFASPQEVCTAILAGSGSGKGVVTLNILATFIADGCPTVYLDYKPDMAAMLWQLERRVGTRILAIDSLAGTADGVRPVRDYGLGINDPDIPGISENLAVVSYLKGLVLIALCAQARNQGYNGVSFRGKKMQFILDEAQKMNGTFRDLKKEVAKFLKDNAPKKGKPDHPQYGYVSKLNDFLESIFSGLNEVRNTTGRTGNVGIVMLGQQADATAWADGAVKRDPLGFLVGNCSAKLLGKGAAGGEKYALGDSHPKGEELLTNLGYFALVPGATVTKSTASTVKVIKTCMVLNENDYSPDNPGRNTSGLLTNITDTELRNSVIDDLYPLNKATGEHYVNEKAGFQGLVEFMGRNIPNFDIGKNLEAGYIECEKVLNGIGLVGNGCPYSTIEEYLFDMSEESLIPCKVLTKLIKENKTIASLAEGDRATRGEGEGDDILGEGFEGDISNLGVAEREQKPEQGARRLQWEDTQDTGGQGQQPRSRIDISKRDTEGVDESELPNEYRRMFERAHNAGPVTPSAPFGSGQPVQPGPGFTVRNDFDVEDDITEGTPGAANNPEMSAENIDNYEAGRNRQADVPEGYSMAPDGTVVPNKPGEVPTTEQNVFKTGGKTGKITFATPSRTAEVFGLSSENSVLVEMPEYWVAERMSGRLKKTLWGARYEFNSRWQYLLNETAKKINPSIVARVIITEDAIVFNKKHIATINILGGDDDVRVEDIVNFSMLAKKFPNISSLVLDKTIFEAAQIELGEPITGLFRTFRSLQKLMVADYGYGKAALYTTREEVMNRRVNRAMQEESSSAQFKNQMEVMAASKNPHLRRKSVGYQNRVYTNCMKFKGQTWKAAKDAMGAKNPKLLKATVAGVGTVALLGIGLAGGLVGKVGDLIFRRR